MNHGAIAFGKDGVWAITDHSDHCVYIFDGSRPILVTKFGSKGIGGWSVSLPCRVSILMLITTCMWFVGITTECKSFLSTVSMCCSSVIRE